MVFLYVTNGIYYEGEWKDGKINGYAIKYDKNGNVFESGWCEDDSFIGSSPTD
jgi:antitoxin component YwqK of YwqJK toxin-antitoxin module